MSIKFNDVYFTYSPKTPFQQEALNGVSFEIKDGSFTCLVGHTGCGKSTLIQELNGLLIPTKGEAIIGDFINSKDNRKMRKKIRDLRRKVGLVFQFSENQLFEETVERDVAFGPMNFGVKKDEAIKLAHESLSLVGLNESFYQKSPFDLSGGEKRRVAIAGVLALKPEILVLDEPTAGLDPRGTRELLELIKELNEKGTTIILVTHDINIVYQYATHVVVMDKGLVVKDCSPDELFKEDVEKYSLETPMIQKVVKLCVDNGLNLDTSKIHNQESLVEQILKARAKK